jgi:CheY-like chemotaxis protein
LLGLINDILDFSKLEAGKLDIVNTDYDVVTTLNDLVNMIRVKTEEKNLQLIVNIDPELPRRLHGDELRIKQCILNLLSNAVKYTPDGSVTFDVTKEPSSSQDNDNEILLKVSVTDTGIGIKEEDIQKLFIAFKRLEESRNRNIEGTGLGLSITESLLNMMGSSLQVKSQYGKGSVFAFTIKQQVCQPVEVIGNYEEAFKQAIEEKREHRQSFTAPNAKILVVDDNPSNLNVFTSLLKDTKMHIDTVNSGKQAIELCNVNTYDVIFLDHMMPDMDGIETLHSLKVDVPVICITANAISGMREMFLEEGFTDYLAKPIDYDRLEQMLLKYLPLPKKNVLLVDDDPLYLKMLRQLLAYKFKVSAVKSGQQALEFLEGHQVDVILLDYQMKGMNGGEVLAQLKKNPATAHIPVIFLTGSADIDTKGERFILKGTDFDTLIQEIENI